MVGEAEGGGVGFSTDQLDMSNTGLFVGGGVGSITFQLDRSMDG